MEYCSYLEVNKLLMNAVGSSSSEHIHQRAIFQFLALARFASEDKSGKLPLNWYHDVVHKNRMSFTPTMLVKTNWLFAIPNGGLRNRRTAAMMKAEGVRSGVPDMMLPITYEPLLGRSQLRGLFIEMKRPEEKAEGVRKKEVIKRASGKLSVKQMDWHEHLVCEGYRVEICNSFNEALTVIHDYLVRA